jgi:hypothetical protein
LCKAGPFPYARLVYTRVASLTLNIATADGGCFGPHRISFMPVFLIL